jgi:hypothetical protein
MTESPSAPALSFPRAWIPCAILALCLTISACGDLPAEPSDSQVDLDAPETVQLMVEAVGADESGPGSTLCQALVRHRDRVGMGPAAEAGAADEAARELEEVILELCG